MDKWFGSKWFVRAISLAFAILLFVFVNVEANSPKTDSRFTPGSSEQAETVDDVPLHIQMDEEQYVVSGAPEYVSVTLEGANSILTPTVRQRNFKAYVDLEGLGEGEHEVEVRHENVPNGLSAYIEPKTIEVTIEERETKEFDVNVDLINRDKLAEGYEVGEPEVEPGTISITSSKSVIDQIAMVKVFVDVADLTDDIKKREVPVNVYDSQGNELNVNIMPETVAVSAELLNPSKTVSVNIPTKGKLPDGYKLTSLTADRDEVTIYGTTSILEGITDISTKEIDLSEIEESGTVSATIEVPDGVRLDDNKVEVKVKIEAPDNESETDSEEVSAADEDNEDEAGEKADDEKENEGTNIIDKTLKNIPITISGAGEGQEISIVDPGSAAVDVTVRGEESAVADVKPGDVNAGADASGLKEGKHQIPITIDGPGSLETSGSLAKVTVEVNPSEDE